MNMYYVNERKFSRPDSCHCLMHYVLNPPSLNFSFYILTICVAFCTATLAKSNVDVVSPHRRRRVLLRRRRKVRQLRLVDADEKFDETLSPLELHVRHQGAAL